MFFDNYVNQCIKKGISPTAAALEMGFHRSEVTRWGRGTTPRRANLLKMATYFGCTADDLLSEIKTPATESDGLTREELELIKAFRSVSPETRSAMLLLLRSAEAAHTVPGDGEEDR